tara:strand:+ start:1882 stop:2085 length:204 start_codon:yes stop_codon:yes gene_type:complete
MADKDTNKKVIPKRQVINKQELKEVIVNNSIISQVRMTTPGARESTKTTIQMRNGTVKEVFGENHND